MKTAAPMPNLTGDATVAERRFKKAILRLVKGGPERLAIEAGQIDAIIDPASGNAILLPNAQRAQIERKMGRRSLIGLAFDWYWEQDERYRFVSHNGATEDAPVLAEEGIVGKSLWDLPIDSMSEIDWQTHRQQLEWRIAFRDLEVRLVDRAGGARHLSVSGEPIFDDLHQFRGYRGITRDITARKRSEALIGESIRFARTILDALGDPLAVLDRAGVVLASNQAWRACADTCSGAGVGISLGLNYLTACEKVRGDAHVDSVAIVAGTRQVIAGERAAFRYDYVYESPLGERWFAVTISGVAGDDVARAIVLHEDISETKRGESLLRLENRVMRALAEAGNSTVGLKSVICAVCETQGWNCGRYFEVDQSDSTLRFRESWGMPVAGVDQFLENSRGLVFRPGAGLAGRVFQSGQPFGSSMGRKERTCPRQP